MKKVLLFFVLIASVLSVIILVKYYRYASLDYVEEYNVSEKVLTEKYPEIEVFLSEKSTISKAISDLEAGTLELFISTKLSLSEYSRKIKENDPEISIIRISSDAINFSIEGSRLNSRFRIVHAEKRENNDIVLLFK
jgi:hypothetical protein